MIPHSRPWRARLGAALAAAALALALTPAVALAVPAAATAAAESAVPASSAAPAARPVQHPVHSACAAPAKRGEMSCLALVRDDVAPSKAQLSPNATAAATPQGYGPSDLRSAYNLGAGGGAGQTVAIVDAYDDPNAESDLAAYRAQYGLPACTSAGGCFRKVDEHGGTDYPTADSGWAEEISLDLDMVSATCPQCDILLVEASSAYMNDLGAAVNEAVALGAEYVSNSYGGPESSQDASADTAYFHHPGVAITVSSGDNGYGVSYPASSPEVTAVGGTSLLPAAGTGRGWTESAWSRAGSGCSAYTAKPSVQHDSGCARRSVADVSAVADPNTGLAVYDTYGVGGWLVVGGTSASSPIIAGVYALAGTPAAGTLPRDYPYANSDALNDVTSGSNGSCDSSYLCTAQAGYDGPTGLGTPDGAAGFSPVGNHAQLTGTVTDAATGSPVAGAKVTAGDGSADTDAQGRYSLLLAPGDHTVAVSAFGYQDGSAQVSLAAGQTLSQDLALTAVPTVHLTGALHDGSGHGWPLYATITVPGDPEGPFHTDPYTGAYDLVLPADSTQQLTFAPALPGYQKVTRSVTVGTATADLDVTAPVDAAACTAPGYAAVYDGLTEPFAAATAPAGWTVDDLAGNGAVWAFGNPGGIGNRTTGSGGFAAVNGRTFPTGTLPDTELTSPATDLSGATTPQLEFHTYLLGYYNPGSHAQADLSTDDGRTWQTVWDKQSAGVSGALQTVALPQAAGKSQVKVRFHFQGSSANDWQVDDVSLGRRSCAPQSGGLLAGRVTDANTKAGLNGVTVGSTEAGGPSARTASTGDPAVGDGFYTLFSAAGTHTFSAGAAHRTTVQKSPKVAADAVTKVNFPLPAGQVVVSGGVTGTVKMGTSKTATVTLHNTGGAPATVKLNQAGGGYSLLTSPSGKPAGVAATTSRHSLVGSRTAAAAVTRPALAGSAADPAWTYGPDYPTGIADNVVSSYDGKVYSVGGLSADGNNVMSLTSAGYVLDPGTGGWKPIAPEPVVRDQGDGAFVGGKLYVTGGWSAAQDGSTVTALDIYDPHTDTWSTGAPVPTAYAASGVTALDGRLYLVGGCRQRCGSTDVWVYTPGTDRWQKAASYPEATSWVSCGTIAGRIYCAGGTTDNQSSTNGYSYDPATNAWKPIAAMPMDVWGAAYSAANGLLIVAGGASGNGTWIDEENYAYDPAADTWSALPTSDLPSYRGGGACGFYTVGGGDEGPYRVTHVLAGFDACDGTSVSWLTLDNRTLTLQPGQSATVTATLDAAAPSVTQPGDFTAEVDLGTDTPYRLAPLPVTMHVTPPSSWGKLTGTVTGVDCDGKPAPLAGASVQISSWVATYSLVTGTDGSFSLWLDKRNNPLTMTAYAPDHLAVTRTVKIVAGITTTEDFSLSSSICL